MKTRRRWSADDLARLVDLVGAGLTQPVIAERLDRPTESVNSKITALRDAGRLPGGDGVVVAPPVTVVRRPCLSCARAFDSEGKHNRICSDCKTSPVFRHLPATAGLSGARVRD